MTEISFATSAAGPPAVGAPGPTSVTAYARVPSRHMEFGFLPLAARPRHATASRDELIREQLRRDHAARLAAIDAFIAGHDGATE